MPGLDNLMIGIAVSALLLYLIGPDAAWQITKGAVEWLLVILVFIWMM